MRTFSEDSTLKPVNRYQANGLKNKIEKFETTLTTFFSSLILERINPVEIELENDVLEVIKLYDLLIAVFEKVV